MPTTVALRSLFRAKDSALLRQPQPLHPLRDTHPQKLKDCTCPADYDGYKICREWSCSHNLCSDPCPRQLSHVCIRCLQPHRLASCLVQQKPPSRSCCQRAKAAGVGGMRVSHATATPAGDTVAPCRSQQKGQQPVHFVALSPGNAIAARLASVGTSISSTETLATHWGSPLLLQMTNSLRPSIILPIGWLFQ